MRVTVKICGLTNADDARAALAAGADYLGFVFFPGSRRCLPPHAAAWLAQIVGRPRVGVFRDQDEKFIYRITGEAQLDLVQLHGSEPPEMCKRLGGPERVIKAVAVDDRIDWERVRKYAPVARILFDAASAQGGGSGRVFDWGLLAQRELPRGFWLAGGLTPGNVGMAIAKVRPAGVDVASGVEGSIGRKDPDRMREFIAAVRRAEIEAARDEARNA